jgi:AcrR family transcriptional regulator
MQRREQLIDVGRKVFAEKGFDGTSIEEIAAMAKVSKPVVYEHFGDMDGLYAVVIDREMTVLMDMLTGALTSTHPRVLLAQAATALFDYIDANTAGFRVLLRPNPRGATFGTVIRDVAAHLEDQLVPVCKRYGYPTKMAPMYAHMLVGMVGLTGEWWAEVRKPGKDEVIAQVVNMTWNGVSRLDPKPKPVQLDDPGPGAHPARGGADGPAHRPSGEELDHSEPPVP